MWCRVGKWANTDGQTGLGWGVGDLVGNFGGLAATGLRCPLRNGAKTTTRGAVVQYRYNGDGAVYLW